MKVDQLHLETPLIESLALGRRVSQRVWLKMEALQPCGSFKARGIGFACQRYVSYGRRRLVSSSGGNAGLAVAYAGRQLGVPVTVVVPHTTSERARQLLRHEAAEVVVFGQSWQEAHERAQTLLDADSAYLHPFDDPVIWEGHASLVSEVVASGLEPGCARQRLPQVRPSCQASEDSLSQLLSFRRLDRHLRTPAMRLRTRSRGIQPEVSSTHR